MGIWTRIFGGWRTWGPNGGSQPGAFDDSPDSPYTSVGADTALKMAAVFACITLRAETIGMLPCAVRDGNKNVLTDHPVHKLLSGSPNLSQTPSEFFSQSVANFDMHGNGYALIERRNDGTPVALTPVESESMIVTQDASGDVIYRYNQKDYASTDVLHFAGFTMGGLVGLPRLQVGRHALSAQVQADETALRFFKQSVKLGGFLVPKVSNLTTAQLDELTARLDRYTSGRNVGRYITLPKEMTAISGKDFRISPADTQLLQSRYFGIEEICRVFNVPPQLIGHTDKASSWASSAEQINLQFLMYSLQPTIVRLEKRMEKCLLSSADRAKGLQIKFNIRSLLRVDSKTRSEQYASALQNGYYSRNEVRALEDMPPIEGGDVYTVQMNLAPTGDLGNAQN